MNAFSIYKLFLMVCSATSVPMGSAVLVQHASTKTNLSSFWTFSRHKESDSGQGLSVEAFSFIILCKTVQEPRSGWSSHPLFSRRWFPFSQLSHPAPNSQLLQKQSLSKVVKQRLCSMKMGPSKPPCPVSLESQQMEFQASESWLFHY